MWRDARDRTSRRQDNETWNEHEKRVLQEARSAFEFSSQVLACCQQIYNEGHHILYKENSVSKIEFLHFTLKVVNIDIEFGRSPNVNTWSSVVSLPADKDIFLQSTCTIRGGPGDLHNYLSKNGTSNTRNVYPAIGNFETPIINLCTSSREDFFIQCRILQSLLKDKTVKLSVEKEDGDPVPSTWLDSCQLLRCKNIIFTSHEGPKIEKIRKLIKSDTPVADQYQVMQPAYQIYNKLMSEIRGTRFSHDTDMRTGYRLLKTAFLNCNKDLVLKHSKEFVKAAQLCAKEWKKFQLEAIEARKEKLENDHNEIMDVFNKLS